MSNLAGTQAGQRLSTRAHRMLRALVLLVLVGVGSALNPSSAYASTCVPTAACLGQAIWDVDVNSTGTNGFMGGRTYLKSNCMTVNNSSTERVRNELRIAENAGGLNAYLSVGIERGKNGYSVPEAYALTYDMQYGLTEDYFADGYVMGSKILAKIQAASTPTLQGRWYVEWDGVGLYYLVDGSQPMWELRTGTVTDSDNAHTYGSSSDMDWYSYTGTLVANWQGATSSAHLVNTSGVMVVNWAAGYQYSWLRDGKGATC